MALTYTSGDYTVTWLGIAGSEWRLDVADTINEISVQTIVNILRQAESSELGISMPQMVDASGKDDLGGGVYTGVTAVSLGLPGTVSTLKDSGTFIIRAGNWIYPDGTIPVEENPAVTYISVISESATVVEVSSGGGSGTSAADVWAYSGRSLTDKSGFSLSSGSISAIAIGVWGALTSALTSVGSVGKLIADNLNATVSSRASQSSVDAIGSDVDTVLSNTTDIMDLSGYSEGSPMTANPTSGTVSANGKRVVVTSSGSNKVYTRDDP